MTVFRLIVRNVALRRLSSFLTAFNVALGVMLVTAILVLRAETEETYRRPSAGYDLVIGPTGSPLQIVLNSIFHVDKSPGLIPYAVHREYDENKRDVRLSVPYAVGDSFRGFRVVATSDGVFSKYFPHPAGEGKGKFQAGRPFRYNKHMVEHALQSLVAGAHDHAHDHIREAVVGHEVANSLGLSIGDEIEPTHGVEGDGDAHDHHQLWTVVGILKRSGTPIDRVVFINLDSFFFIGDHGGAIISQTNEPAISACLLFVRPGIAQARLPAQLNKRTDIQVANVSEEVGKLLAIVGKVDVIFLITAILVVVIGVVSIMVAILNTMNERRREIAILRAVGASRRFVLLSIVGEAAALALAGGLAGLALCHAALHFARDFIANASNVEVQAWRVLPEELWIVGLVGFVGAVAGLLPALKAYNTDVAKNLTPLS